MCPSCLILLVPASVGSSADILSEVLVLPESESQRPKRKTKPALNSKAVCITSSSVLEQLQHEKEEQEALVLEKEKKQERERKRQAKVIEKEKKQEVERKKLEREAKKIEASRLRESKKKDKKRADPEE